ncbi:MAG: sensor histidine kinase [Planctomycetota bacterium]|jgi:nitrogen fixation/metabolism regulation signal transduction histidine kinase
MNDERRGLREEELVLFGRIGAGVTHEMRNVLSVIREYSGLLRDLLSTATRKKPPDAAQLIKLSESITNQVRKGTRLMERFSQFAHAADEQTASFDLRELAGNTAALARRSVAQVGCVLEVDLGDEPIPVRSNPLSLQQAVYAGIQLILEAADQESTGEPVTITVTRQTSAAVISIAGGAGAGGSEIVDRGERIARRMEELGGSVETSSQDQTLSVSLMIPTEPDAG